MFAHGLPSPGTKVTQLLVLVVVLSLLFHTRRWQQFQSDDYAALQRSHADFEALPGPTPEEQYLARLRAEYGLTNETVWRAWRVSSSEQASGGASVTQVPNDFASNRPQVIDLDEPDRAHLHAWKELHVPVPGSPLPAQIDASDFLFGVTTTYARVKANDFGLVRDWARWLTGGNRHGNGASLVLVLDQAQESEVHEIDELLDGLGIDAHITTSLWAMSSARRYYELVGIMKMLSAKLARNGQHKKWFGLLEDSIFLPNLSYLRDRLYAYNSDEKLYVGLPSERSDWVIGDGAITTHGGGAVFLTHAAVIHLATLPCFERKDRTTGSSFRAKKWDGQLQDCVMEHTDMMMRVLPSYYSPGDSDNYALSGDSYETGIQPLALHQYQDRHHLNPSMAHLVTDVCGEACFLQRYRFRDDWVLVNGYSITEYPDGLDLQDDYSYSQAMPLSERTHQKRLSVVSRVLVDEDSVDRKILTWRGRRNVWRLMDSAVGRSGAVWQAYVKRGGVGDDTTADTDWRDSVIVMIWEAGLSTGF